MYQSAVVPRLIQQVYRTRPDIKLPKTAIHKILFKVRATLPEKDQIREHLPYYWYKYGPYSDVVETSIKNLKRRGILREEKTKTGISLLVLNPSRAVLGTIPDQTLAVVESVARDIDPFHIGTFVNQIYRDYAPYEFMSHYKIDFLITLKDYHTSHQADQMTLNPWWSGELDTPEINRLEGMLYDCEAMLVDEPLFERFNDEFMAYVSGTGKAFDIARKNESAAYPLIEATYASAKAIWYTFAKGVRIQDKGHDGYYDRRLKEWNLEYQRALSDLIPKVNAYTRTIRGSACHAPSRGLSERSKRILSSLIEGYLS